MASISRPLCRILKNYAADLAKERAKNKEKLAWNIVTIGGSREQQELNLAAFQQAIFQYAAEKRQEDVNALEAENKALKEQTIRMRSPR